MKDFISTNNITNLKETVLEAIQLKSSPLKYKSLGQDKTLGLLFFNNSLRTRLSTQKAAQNLGMNVMVMNFGSEGWALEYGDGQIMDQGKSEHVKEAAQVISQYCDIIGIRAFAGLEDRDLDYSESVITAFQKYASVPILNMESATRHPLQALTDLITIEENRKVKRPKVVLTWAPHPKALPQAVANSFVEIMKDAEVDLVVTHPKGYELAPEFMENVTLEYDQEKALEGADFVSAKNWSAFNDYGKIISQDPNWMVDMINSSTQFMHCLPVRRNVVVADKVLDSNQSLVIEQANNRTYAAQIILKKMLENG
ncbi:MAG: acetylornithine carbamoyltransferase [Flavobacteriaceae bacterium]